MKRTKIDFSQSVSDIVSYRNEYIRFIQNVDV